MLNFKSDNLRIISAVLATVILGVVGMTYVSDRLALDGGPRGTDQPPTIEFTWEPIGQPYLADIRGKVVMKDDRGLDFTTYAMTVVEAGKTLDLPIPGMLGKEYAQDISFAQFARNGDIIRKGEITVEFRIKDTAGQEAVLTKVVKFRNDMVIPTIKFTSPTE